MSPGYLPKRAGDENYIGVGYIYSKALWGKGYVFESASACIDYAFNVLQINEITAQIRPENAASRKAAEKLGMVVKKQFTRNYKGKDMLYLLYSRIK